MTDEERKAQLRSQLDNRPAKLEAEIREDYDQDLLSAREALLLRLLDEARAGMTDIERKVLQREIAERDAKIHKLMANQCHAPWSDEYGNHRCHIEDRLREANAEIAERGAKIHELMGEADEARAEIVGRKSNQDELVRVLTEQETEVARLKEVITRLQAPPGASTMERAERIIGAHVDGLGEWKTETFAELIATLKVEVARAIEQAERKARAAAIEEAAKIAERIRQCPFADGRGPPGIKPEDPCPVCGGDENTSATRCQSAATEIRALPDASPPA